MSCFPVTKSRDFRTEKKTNQLFVNLKLCNCLFHGSIKMRIICPQNHQKAELCSGSIHKPICYCRKGRSSSWHCRGSDSSLPNRFFLNAAYVYKVQGVSEDTASFEFGLLHDNNSRIPSNATISSGSSQRNSSKFEQALNQNATTVRMPGIGICQLLPEAPGGLPAMPYPFRQQARRLVGCFRRKKRLKTELPLHYFAKALAPVLKGIKTTGGQELQNKHQQEKRLKESILSTVPDYIHVYNPEESTFFLLQFRNFFFGAQSDSGQ